MRAENAGYGWACGSGCPRRAVRATADSCSEDGSGASSSAPGSQKRRRCLCEDLVSSWKAEKGGDSPPDNRPGCRRRYVKLPSRQEPSSVAAGMGIRGHMITGDGLVPRVMALARRSGTAMANVGGRLIRGRHTWALQNGVGPGQRGIFHGDMAFRRCALPGLSRDFDRRGCAKAKPRMGWQQKPSGRREGHTSAAKQGRGYIFSLLHAHEDTNHSSLRTARQAINIPAKTWIRGRTSHDEVNMLGRADTG